jgi:tetratricopeptide (TPR) repeat protein
MSDELINALTKLNSLRVVARTSSFAFKGKNEDIQEIGRKLRVDHVLEGSVRKSGNRLRITAQLIKITDGYHLWSERYDRTMDDVFAIQDEISLSIVEKLKVSLLEGERDALARRSTENLQAYNLFLQGRFAANKHTGESLHDAIKKFQGAITLSPNYAQAYADMAFAYYLLGFMYILTPKEVYPKSIAAARKAIEIDPTVADAHVVLAAIKDYDWEWEAAGIAFKKAIELNPNSAYARVHYSFHLLSQGRINESLKEMTTAYSLDPLRDPLMLGLVLLRSGKLGEAQEQFRKSVEIEPRRAYSLWMSGQIDVIEGRYEKGLSTLRDAVSLSGNNPVVLAAFGWGNAIAGKRAEAMKVLEELHDRSSREPIRPYFFAKIYSALGEHDLAFEWLEKAYVEHDSSLAGVMTDESLAGLHQDPRFDELLKKMNLLPAT